MEEFFGKVERNEPWWDRRDRAMMDRVITYVNACNRWPASYEDLEIFEFHHKVDLETGDALYEAMPAFKPMESCNKCGNSNPKKFHLHYVSASKGKTDCPRHGGEREHLHVGCNKCGYHFPMKVAKPEDSTSESWYGHEAPTSGIPG